MLKEIDDVARVPFTRLEMRQILTAIERVEPHEPDPAFAMLREKLKIELGRSQN